MGLYHGAEGSPAPSAVETDPRYSVYGKVFSMSSTVASWRPA